MIADVDQLSTDCVITGVKLLFSDHSKHSKHIINWPAGSVTLTLFFSRKTTELSESGTFIWKVKTLPGLHVGVVCMTFLLKTCQSHTL